MKKRGKVLTGEEVEDAHLEGLQLGQDVVLDAVLGGHLGVVEHAQVAWHPGQEAEDDEAGGEHTVDDAVPLGQQLLHLSGPRHEDVALHRHAQNADS